MGPPRPDSHDAAGQDRTGADKRETGFNNKTFRRSEKQEGHGYRETPSLLCTLKTVRTETEIIDILIRGWQLSVVSALMTLSSSDVMEKEGFGGQFMNLAALITTYYLLEISTLEVATGHLFLSPVLQKSPSRALRAPESHDMLTGNKLIRCQKFIRVLFNIVYLSLACHFKTRRTA